MNQVGALLRRWRSACGLSQLDLAMEAGVSAKHLSFVETGRAQPSRDMVLTLAGALDVPHRDCNVLLKAAGFAEVYGETELEDARMAQIVHAMQLILERHQPFAAVVFDRKWEVVMANRAMLRLYGALGGAPVPLELACRVLPRPRVNALEMLFGETRRHVRNWDEVARSTLARLHREVRSDADDTRRALLQKILAAPSVPEDWRDPLIESPHDLILPVELTVGKSTLRFFTTITTLGTPQDVTLQELHIESYHPMDAESEELARSLGA